jgi:hypothetical protein
VITNLSKNLLFLIYKNSYNSIIDLRYTENIQNIIKLKLLKVNSMITNKVYKNVIITKNSVIALLKKYKNIINPISKTFFTESSIF